MRIEKNMYKKCLASEHLAVERLCQELGDPVLRYLSPRVRPDTQLGFARPPMPVTDPRTRLQTCVWANRDHAET